MEAVAPLRRRESIIERGPLALQRYGWEGAPAARSLAIVHGFGEHAGRYDAMASWFAGRGFAVHAIDLRGHGRSPGPRGHVRSFDDFLDDVDAWLARVRAEHPERPLVLLGHSMGGLIAATYAVRRQPSIQALVLSGPALELASGGLRLAFARALRRLAPRLALDAGLDAAGLSRDPEVVRAYQADPLVHGRMSASLGVELFDTARATRQAGARLEVPALLLHGGDDPLCSPEGTKAFAADVATPGTRLRIYEGLRHEIFNEPERESIYADVLEWLDREAPPARESG